MTGQFHQVPTALSGLRVLVVEDELLLAIELVDELEQLGAIPIGPIPSVEEALAAIENSRIDAAMLNVHLRGQLSFPIANALIERHIPFVFVTGNDAFVREHFPNVPAYPKPYDMATIVDALEVLIRHPDTGPQTVAGQPSGGLARQG